MGAFSLRNTTRRKAPRVPFAKVAAEILPGWEVSLALVGSAEAQRLNKTLRKKNYVPNVLSYEVGVKSGEVIICVPELATQAPAYGLTPNAYCLYLFIHGLLHLKGSQHGATMERRERTLLKKWGIAASTPPHVPTHRHRHRHWHLPGQAGRRRRARG